jgi:hypothetical protein
MVICTDVNFVKLINRWKDTQIFFYKVLLLYDDWSQCSFFAYMGR